MAIDYLLQSIRNLIILRRSNIYERTVLMPIPTAKAKKITVDIPQSLYKETEEMIHERHTTISVFVREAMERHLKSIKRRKLERELEEGYLANASLGDQIHEEFEFVDAEQA